MMLKTLNIYSASLDLEIFYETIFVTKLEQLHTVTVWIS